MLALLTSCGMMILAILCRIWDASRAERLSCSPDADLPRRPVRRWRRADGGGELGGWRGARARKRMRMRWQRRASMGGEETCLLCMAGAGSGGKMGGGEGMAGRAGAGAAAAAKEKSGFAATCSLLSRYMKEKKGGALQGLVGLDMSPPAAVVVGGGAFQPPTTMNLLSGLEEPDTAAVELPLEKSSAGQLLKATTDNQDAREDAHQLTIFYGGKVVVVENFPSTKVKDLLQMANRDDGDKAGSSSLVQQSPPQPAQNTLPDLPIARRNSLHRFLEKRKGRIVAKAPYQINSASAAPSKQAHGDNAWLGLGQVTN